MGLLRVGIPYEIILLRCAWSHAYRLSTGSLCALSHASQEPVRAPMGSIWYTWTRADAMRDSEQPYAKTVETAHVGPVRISVESLSCYACNIIYCIVIYFIMLIRIKYV